MDAYEILKWVHVVSSTVLSGTGLGTAFHGFMAHRSGNVAVRAIGWRNVVWADWLFTTPSVIVQPLSGFALIYLGGYDLYSGWILASIGLYLLAGACWLPVVWLQAQMARMAREAHLENEPLHERYFVYARVWFALGWPAFIALIVVFYLMTAKPYF